MPDIPQLVAAIDSRLADLAAEMSTLDAAKAELAAPRADRRVTPPSQQAERASRRTPSKPVEAPSKTGDAVNPPRPTRKRATRATRPRSGGSAVQAETLKRVLADTSAGLSANAIAKQAGTGYGRTLKLLHELEAAGQIRRLGARRSTVWQVITDDERIAQRAAELERLRGAPSRRRARARAS